MEGPPTAASTGATGEDAAVLLRRGRREGLSRCLELLDRELPVTHDLAGRALLMRLMLRVEELLTEP